HDLALGRPARRARAGPLARGGAPARAAPRRRAPRRALARRDRPGGRAREARARGNRGRAPEAALAMANKFMRGALVEFVPTFGIPIPNVIVFQLNPETMTHAWTPAEAAPPPAAEGARSN